MTYLCAPFFVFSKSRCLRKYASRQSMKFFTEFLGHLSPYAKSWSDVWKTTPCFSHSALGGMLGEPHVNSFSFCGGLIFTACSYILIGPDAAYFLRFRPRLTLASSRSIFSPSSTSAETGSPAFLAYMTRSETGGNNVLSIISIDTCGLWTRIILLQMHMTLGVTITNRHQAPKS